MQWQYIADFFKRLASDINLAKTSYFLLWSIYEIYIFFAVEQILIFVDQITMNEVWSWRCKQVLRMLYGLTCVQCHGEANWLSQRKLGNLVYYIKPGAAASMTGSFQTAPFGQSKRLFTASYGRRSTYVTVLSVHEEARKRPRQSFCFWWRMQQGNQT